MQQSLKGVHRVGPWVMGAVLAASPMAALAQDDALNQAPSGADVVVAVPSLANLSRELASLRQSLNLPNPDLDNALQSFKQELGLTEGIRDDGAFLVVIPDVAQIEDNPEEPEILMLVPVSDYGALVQQLGAEDAGGVSPITLPNGASGFAKEADGFAVLGPSRVAVENYQSGGQGAQIIERIGSLGQNYLESADVFVYVDMEEVGPVVLPQIQRGVQQMTQMFDQMAQGGMMDPNAVATQKAIWQLYGTAAETVVNEADTLLMSLDAGDQGVGYTWTLTYAPDSTLASFFPGNGGDGSSLSLLPSRPFIYAMAVDAGAIDLAGIYQRVIDAVPEGAQNPMMVGADQWMPLLERLQSFSSAFYVPDQQAMMSGNLLNTLTVLEVEEPDQYVESLKGYIQSMNGLEVPLGVPAPPAGGPGQMQGQADQLTMSYTSNYSDNVLQLEGEQVDQYQIAGNMPPQMMQQMGPAAGIMSMFMRYQGYVATKDGKVLVTTVTDPQLVTQAFQGVEQQDGIGAAGPIGRIREAALPPQPAAQFFLDLGGVAQTAQVAMGPMAPQVDVPADLPPIASGLGVDEGSLAFRAYMPIETLQWIGTTVQDIRNQMGGQRGPGGPGMGPGGPTPPPPF